MYLNKEGAADISQADGTNMWLIEAPYAGRVKVDRCFVAWTEATGTQTTTQGVVTISVAGTEVGTLTANQEDAIGQSQTFVVDGTVATASQPYAEFAAGDAILVEIKTQAVDGTVVGDGDVFLNIEFAAV